MGKTPKVMDKPVKKKLFGTDKPTGLGADWEQADAALLKMFTLAVVKRAGAVRYGYTRDGTNYSVGVYGDGDPYTLYCGGTYDINTWLRERLGELTDA